MNINDLFVHWSKVGNKKYNTLLLTATTTLLWAIWLTRNEVVLDRYKPKSFFGGTVPRDILATSMEEIAAA
jgi:hypothetical protein